MLKEKEMLQEMFPILLKYDMETIEKCFAYIKKNKKILCDISAFLEMNENISKNSKKKNAVDEIVMSVEQDRRPIIKRISKYLTARGMNLEQLQLISKQYFDSKNICISFLSNDREETVENIVRNLCILKKDEIIQFEKLIQVGIANASENTLENWSKVIVRE